MISSLLIRRYWIIKNRLVTTLGLLLFLPIFVNIVVNLPLKRIIVSPLWKIPHEQWIFPGLVIIVVTIMMIPSVYRDLFELRIHKKLLPSLALTPISKSKYLYCFLLTVAIESVIYAIVIMTIFSLLIVPDFAIIDYLIMFPFVLFFIALTANILVTLSLIVDKTTLYNILMLMIFLFIIFASGLIIEFEYYPEVIGNIIKYLPTGQIMHSMRMALFSDVVNWAIILLIITTIIVWSYINGLIFNKRLYR